MKKIILVLIAIAMVGCNTLGYNSVKEPTYEDAAVSKFVQANYAATDALLGSLRKPIASHLPIMVATLVNIDELTQSSRLGRLISEQIGARLTQLGYNVIELKLRGDIFIKRSEGELLLSREIKDIMQYHKSNTVVVGTYSVAKDFVYINIKMVDGQENVSIAANDYVLPLDGNVRALLSARNK
ncbi:MAG: FlgO family outer membrane protein [Desulfomicrobiaceae bacterium]